MRSRTRKAIRQHSLLVLLLLGVCCARLSSGFGLESIGSFDRLVDHPGQYLEGGVLASTDVTHKHFFFGSRRFKMHSNEGSLQGGTSRFKGSSVTNAFSDGGGSLQLCLLLVFCVAVLCCASMSISPWYKSENFLLRKAMAVMNAALALVSEGLGGDASQSDGGEGTVDASKGTNAGGRGSNSQTPATKSAKKVGKKKRRSGGHFLASQPGHRVAGESRLEKTLSTSSAGDACSEASGGTDVGSAKEPLATTPRGAGAAAHANPADIQIARIEAEAARQSELRASKLRKAAQKHEKQAEPAPQEGSAKPKKDEVEAALERPTRSAIPVKPLERGLADKGKRVVERAIPVDDRYRRPGPLSTSSSEGKRPVIAKAMGDVDPKDRLGRRVAGADKPVPPQSQVLVVPRRQPLRPKARPLERVLNEEEQLPTPQTPERSTSSASTFSSPHSSVFSPHHLSRPYAQVARGDLPLTAVPPPPPPPPRLAALPPGAVYAREFVPSTLGSAPALGDSAVLANNHIHVSAMPPAPLQLPEPLSPTSSSVAQTSSPSPSPFPGMSLHRRLVPASPPPAPLNPSLDGYPQSSSNSYTSGSAFRGLGFPGAFDNIWSTSAVRAAGETSSWLATELVSQSQDHSWESERGLEAASEGVNLPRLESW